MKIPQFRSFLIILAIPLLAVGCSLPLGTSGSAESVGGVYKTTNSGLDWVSANKVATEKRVGRNGKVEVSTSEDLAKADIRQMIFIGSKVFASARTKGLYSSDDEGMTWKNVISGVSVWSVASLATDGQKMLVGGGVDGFGRVLLTEDGGKTWQVVYAESSSRSTIVSVSVDERGRIAVGSQNGSVVLSLDGGKTWSRKKSLEGEISQVMWEGEDLYVVHMSRGLFVLRGENFVDLSAPLANFQPPPNQSVGSVTFTRPNRYSSVALGGGVLYLATDVGVFTSSGQGTNWTFLSIPAQGLGRENQVSAVAVDSKTGKVFVGIAGSIYITENGGGSWRVSSVARGGIIRYILIDPEQSKVVYVGLERVR